MEGKRKDMRQQLNDLGISSDNIDEIEVIILLFTAVNGIKEAGFYESDLDLEWDSQANGGTDGREGAGLFTRR